tara:strand:+ start:247 stop:429 length:183 start_codon:yes stop_codon:yes gene_type:complete
MELENHKEEQKADRWAEDFSNKLFVSKDIGVMQANSVYLDVKKIVLDAMLRTNKLRNSTL